MTETVDDKLGKRVHVRSVPAFYLIQSLVISVLMHKSIVIHGVGQVRRPVLLEEALRY